MPQNWYTLGHLFGFSWRASRTEFFLLHLLIPMAVVFPLILFASLFDRGSGDDGADIFSAFLAMIYGLYALAASIAMLAVNVRRLHDQGKSGWWWLATWLPILGWLFWLMVAFTSGDEADNLYGPNPRSGERPGTGAEAMARVFD